jgi:hypothetical protein
MPAPLVVTVRAVPILDPVVQRVAKGLGAVFHRLTGQQTIRSAGLFWVGGPAVVGAWREADAWTLRAGRLELVVYLARVARNPPAQPFRGNDKRPGR